MSTYIALLMMASAALAQTPLLEPVNPLAIQRWNRAKEEYRQTIERSRAELLQQLQQAAESARAAGDAAQAQQITAGVQAFEKTGTLPKSVIAATFEQQTSRAQATLRKEAQLAKVALVEANLEQAAAQVDNDLAAILTQTLPARPQNNARGIWTAASGEQWTHRDGREWVRADTDQVWVENARNEKYTELELVLNDHSEFVRLYGDHAEIKTTEEPYRDWQRGKWTVLPVQPLERSMWIGNPGSTWRFQHSREWRETDMIGGTHDWMFVQSTALYVELIDQDRDRTVRLYADRAELKQFDKGFVPLAKGTWVVQPAPVISLK